MPSKKSSTPREIIRVVSGISIDPLMEKFASVLFSRYRRNISRGYKKPDALKKAARDIFFSIAGIPSHPVASPPSRRAPRTRAKPAKAHEETEEEAIARLKKTMDGFIKD